jgi:sarcosine oxidase subunit alpha
MLPALKREGRYTERGRAMPRIQPLRDPVTIRLDGAEVPAERGEPAAVALVAAGHTALARSPKFHRPRGPACLRGACDGCLARVDDVPNVMTCRVPAVEGMRIETQNVVGRRDLDLLRVVDWFFPEGMNHHELLAGVPGVQRVMQGLARRVAGLGRLPGEPGRAPGPARRRDVDVLIAGAGPAGMTAALELARRGRRVEIVDDDLDRGGSAAVLAKLVEGWAPLLATFDDLVARSVVTLRRRTTAAGVFGDDLLVVSDGRDREAGGGVEVLTARTLVLAPGAHDGALPFEGNDLPGVMSARAGCRLLSYGVTPGRRVVIVAEPGAGPFGAAFAAACPEAIVVAGVPVRVAGSPRVKGVTVATSAGEQELPCDALLVETTRSPAYELCSQAGAELSHDRAGFTVRPGEGGRIREGVFVVGEAVGTRLEPDAMASGAKALGDMA